MWWWHLPRDSPCSYGYVWPLYKTLQSQWMSILKRWSICGNYQCVCNLSLLTFPLFEVLFCQMFNCKIKSDFQPFHLLKICLLNFTALIWQFEISFHCSSKEMESVEERAAKFYPYWITTTIRPTETNKWYHLLTLSL